MPASDPLLGLDSVMLSPHAGYVTHNSYTLFYRQAVEDITAWWHREALRVL